MVSNEASGGGRVRRGENLLHLPKDRIQVDVPIQSRAYQEYLAANRAAEDAREATGSVTSEALQRLRDATAGVDREAQSRIGADRSKP